jgi:hypothetical protein
MDRFAEPKAFCIVPSTGGFSPGLRRNDGVGDIKAKQMPIEGIAVDGFLQRITANSCARPPLPGWAS